MKINDIGLSISPLAHLYIAQLQAMEVAEQRRKNEEEIASAMGVPAELLFKPLIQRLISGPLLVDRFQAFVVSPSPRRTARRAHRKRTNRR